MTEATPVARIEEPATSDTTLDEEATALLQRLDSETHRLIETADGDLIIEELHDDGELDPEDEVYVHVGVLTTTDMTYECATHLAENLDDPYRVVKDVLDVEWMIEKRLNGGDE